MKRRLRLINFILMATLLFGMLGFAPRQVVAQDRAVEAGDIAIILMNADTPDSVAFVALADIPAGTVIYFTDSGWIPSTSLFRSTEGGFKYTVGTEGLLAGTIIYRNGPWTETALILPVGSPWSNANDSNIGNNGANFAIDGDQVLVFTGSTASPSFVYGLNNSGAAVWQNEPLTSSSQSGLPSGLVNGATAIAINEIDNARFKCTSTISGTKAQILALISNPANWEGDNTTLQVIDTNCSFTVSNPTATAPQVSSTNPADEATMVALNSDIDITFADFVTVAANWYEIDCSVSGLHTAVVTDANPVFTLNPDSDFVNDDVCTVTVFAEKVTDFLPPGLPTPMEEDYVFSFSAPFPPRINEVDADTPSTDSAEFLELYDGGVGNTPLDGLVLVFYNGSNNLSYLAFDLDGLTTDTDGYFVLCGNAANVTNCDLDVTPNTDLIQNGQDAIALYQGDSTSFPTGTGVTLTNLIDAIVYDTSDPDDPELLVLLNLGQPQVDENGGGDKDNESNQRCPNGSGGLRNTDTYTQLPPTPGTENCAPTDTAPAVQFTTPADEATMVSVNSDIEITFTEAMTLSSGWFEIDCSISGAHTAAVMDVDPLFILNPDIDFDLGDICEVTVVAANASDEDSIDPPDTLAEDYIFTFDVLLSPKLNEFSASTTGADVEYIEIFGDPNTDYSAYTLLEIEGDWITTSAVEGYIDEVIAIGTTNANGFYLQNLAANALENGTITLLLVKDFTGTFGEDLDIDDDGVLDSTPWSAIVDAVAINDGGSSDLTYGFPVLFPLYDGFAFAPGGASRIPDGVDTDTTADWVRNNFNLAGIPGNEGVIPVIGEAWNTPGTTNIAYTPPVEAAPTVTATIPLDNAVDVDKATNISITFSEAVTVTGNWYDISCTLSGTHTAVVTDTDPTFVLDPDVNFTPNDVCTVTIYGTGVNDDDLDDATYDYMQANYSFDFTVGEACGDTFTATYAIQGSGATSPLVGTPVVTEGVVVGDFQTGAYVSGTKNGFYIQDVTGDDDSSTSDGLFIYTTSTDVQVGDHVRVAGTVAEYTTGSDSLTQVTSVTQIWTCSTGNTIIPTTLSLPVAADFDYEDYEGMLVTYPQDLVIAEYFNFDRYGEIVLTSERHMTPTALYEPGSAEYIQAVADFALDKITLDDGRTAQNPDPALHPNGSIFDMTNLFRGGSTVSDVTGILDFYVSLYRIQPTQGAVYTDSNPRTLAPDLAPGELKIASFNVLNYFLTLDADGNKCGPSANLDCRGANTPEELARQRAKILAALSTIDADIAGLMEIQNDEGESVADLVSGLNDILGADTYDYIDTGYIGTDAIKLALIYKPAAVTPDGAYEILDSSVDPAFIDTANRPALAQVFVDNGSGEKIVVAVNHLKSKGSACSGDPDLGDGAGNCNLTRTTAAEALVGWLADETVFPDVENFLIIGDLNSYDKEDPIDAIKLGADETASTDDDYVDMIEAFQGDEAYGYVYDGQVGYLDHALASEALVDNILDVNFWHINADEADLIDYNMDFKADAQDALYAPDAYRASDHDPVVVSLTLEYAPVAMDDDYVTPEDTVLTVPAPGVLENDTDANLNDILTVELVDDVTIGTLVLNANGSFTYTPELNFFGEVTFTYLVFDGYKYSETVTVTITVEPENDSPVALDDAYEMVQNSTLIVSAVDGVLANDTDPDPGDTLWVNLMTPTQHGTVTLQADGSFVYTPALGYVGMDTFTYALISFARGGGVADTATVTITVKSMYTNFYYFPLIFN